MSAEVPPMVNVKIDGVVLSAENFSALQRQGVRAAMIATIGCAVLVWLALEVRRLNTELRVTQEYLTQIRVALKVQEVP